MRHHSWFRVYHMTHFYMTWLTRAWHDWFMCHTRLYLTWRIHVWHDMFIRDVTDIWHDSFVRDVTHPYVTRLIHMWHDASIFDMTHSCVTCSFVTWFAYIGHDSFVRDMTHSYVTRLIHMWHERFKFSILKVFNPTLALVRNATYSDGVATISRLLKIIGLFCRISFLL